MKYILFHFDSQKFKFQIIYDESPLFVLQGIELSIRIRVISDGTNKDTLTPINLYT